MENISAVAEQLVKVFDKKIQCTTEQETCLEGLTSLDDEGRLVVASDDEKNTWVCTFHVLHLTHIDIQEILFGAFGQPTRTHKRTETIHRVNNWDLPNGVLVVHILGRIELTEEFQKVPSSRRERRKPV